MTVLLAAIAVVMLLVGAGATATTIAGARAMDRLVRRRVDVTLVRPEPLPVETITSAQADGDGARRWLNLLAPGVPKTWKSQTSTVVLIGAALVAGLASAGLFAIVLRFPIWVWAPVSVVGFFIPPQILLRMEQGKLEASFVDLFPDAIDMIVRMLRAGLPLSVAINVVGKEAGSPVKDVFAGIADQMAIGVSFEQALRLAGQRIPAKDFRFFIVSASLQQATGGNLAATLEVLSDMIRKRRSGRMKAKAVTAEIRMSISVLASIPFVVVGGLMVLQPQYLAPMISDRRGNVILALAVGLLLTGFGVMQQMMRSAVRM